MMYEYEPIGRYTEYGTEMCLSDAIEVINSCENGNGKIRELVVKGNDEYEKRTLIVKNGRLVGESFLTRACGTLEEKVRWYVTA